MMRHRRGIGAVDTGSCPDAFGGDPCAALLAQQSPAAASQAAGLPASTGSMFTDWLMTNQVSLLGMPGWALVAVTGGLLLFAMGGGRRR